MINWTSSRSRQRLRRRFPARCSGPWPEICIQDARIVGNDNCVRYKGRALQIPEDRHRHHYVKAKVRVHEYTDGHLAIFHGPRRLAIYDADGTFREESEKQAA